MKKITLFLVFTLLFSACAIRGENIIERHASSSVVNYETLLHESDYFLKVRVLDELTSTISYKTEKDGIISDFYSIRNVEILDDFDSGFNHNEIYVSEAKIDKNIYRYSNTRSLKKDGTYLIYLMKSDQIDGYFIPIFEGAIINLEEKLEDSSPEVTHSDFMSLLSANGVDSKEYANAKYIAGIKETVSSEKNNVNVDKLSIDYYLSPYGEENSILEINNIQYLIE